MKIINPNYKIPLVGSYNPGINLCNKCGYQFKDNNDHFLKHILGFADSRAGLMIVVECPKCFHKYFFHAREKEDYSYTNVVIEHIELGLNIHYK